MRIRNSCKELCYDERVKQLFISNDMLPWSVDDVEDVNSCDKSSNHLAFIPLSELVARYSLIVFEQKIRL